MQSLIVQDEIVKDTGGQYCCHRYGDIHSGVFFTDAAKAV